jgi:ABC-type bacteriocin/lantibiotic exporter with double-glycine peptidase domain
VLLTGASGSGTSTILRAISAARRGTLVAQDAHVFDGTIRDNLELADPGAGEPELWRALAAVAYHRSAALVIALHDRQAAELPWTPTARVALAATTPTG